MKTVRDVWSDTRTNVPAWKIGEAWWMERERRFLGACGGYPVIEPSGVVLAVDREKLAKVLCVARHCSDQNDEQYTDTPLCRACNAPAIVDAILTSMAEQGFREVEELRHIAVPEHQYGIEVPVLVSHELFRTHEARGCRFVDIASLKPLPPAKED